MKKDRGAITIITLTTILFMLAFLIGAYTIVMNRRQVQAEIKKKTKDIYQNNVKNAEEIYQGYFAENEEIVPVWTEGNLLKICKIIQEDSDGYIFSKGKIYKCTASSNYKLENDINLNDAEYIAKYPELFEEKKWIESETATSSNKIVTGTRWKGILETANFDYGDKIIRETDSKNNVLEHRKINVIEYIESTGTQWIDTGIIPNQDTRLEMIAETTTDVADTENGKGFIPYGAGSSYNSNAFECYTQSSKYEFNYDGQYDFIGTAKVGEKISISHNKNTINITAGTTKYSKNFEYNAFTAPYTMLLFAINRGNILAGKARIYSCQIFSNEILARDFIPALDKSNVPCLYDKVSKQYFYNSGTGTFNYAN